MGLQKVALKQVSVVPAGVLGVNSDAFLASTHAFWEGAPLYFPKAHALRYKHIWFGNDRMHIRGEWTFKMALNQVWVVPYVVLRVNSYVFLTYTRAFSNQEPIPFSKAHALSYTHSKIGNDLMHIRGEMTSRKWTLNGFVRGRPES